MVMAGLLKVGMVEEYAECELLLLLLLLLLLWWCTK